MNELLYTIKFNVEIDVTLVYGIIMKTLVINLQK